MEEGEPEEEADVAADLRHHGKEGVEVVLLAAGDAGREVEEGGATGVRVQLFGVLRSLKYTRLPTDERNVRNRLLQLLTKETTKVSQGMGQSLN